MGEWTFSEWLRFGLIWLAIFGFVGGIIAQTSGGISGRGFMEGVWKGVEIFALIVVIILVLIGVFWGLNSIASTLNSSG